MVNGIKVPDWLAKYGISKALQDITPEDEKEALSMSKDEVEINSTMSYILNSAYDLIDNDSMEAYYSYDIMGITEGTNSKGQKRNFTHIVSGKFQNFRFSYKKYTFTGNMVVSFTDEDEVKKEEEVKKDK